MASSQAQGEKRNYRKDRSCRLEMAEDQNFFISQLLLGVFSRRARREGRPDEEGGTSAVYVTRSEVRFPIPIPIPYTHTHTIYSYPYHTPYTHTHTHTHMHPIRPAHKPSSPQPIVRTCPQQREKRVNHADARYLGILGPCLAISCRTNIIFAGGGSCRYCVYPDEYRILVAPLTPPPPPK